ncbi:MAG: SHOCT domain-containing protein [Streptosporangiales bacterium]|nr:SHOCT domain-containing protein [Streptosporangiales bacterium]
MLHESIMTGSVAGWMPGMGGAMMTMMVAGVVLILALFVLIVLAIVWLARRLSAGQPEAPAGDAEQLLRRRYAAGEINDEQFTQQRQKLRER